MAKIFAMDYDMAVDVTPYLIMKYFGEPEGEEVLATECVEVQLQIDFGWSVTQLNDAKINAIKADILSRYSITVANTDIFYNKHDRPLL